MSSKKQHSNQEVDEQLLEVKLELLPIYRRVYKQLAFRVEWSSRLKRNLAITYPVRNIIRVTTELASPSNQCLLPEVLTHEIAHLEAYRLVQRKENPHGDTWKKIMASEGFEPRTRLSLVTNSITGRVNKRVIYLHTCPICSSTRVAKKPINSWRCSSCVDAGLDGRLSIKRK